LTRQADRPFPSSIKSVFSWSRCRSSSSRWVGASLRVFRLLPQEAINYETSMNLHHRRDAVSSTGARGRNSSADHPTFRHQFRPSRVFKFIGPSTWGIRVVLGGIPNHQRHHRPEQPRQSTADWENDVTQNGDSSEYRGLRTPKCLKKCPRYSGEGMAERRTVAPMLASD